MESLSEYLEGKDACNFRREKGELVWNCKRKLFFTRKWAKENGMDFKEVKKACEDNGGFCDCEVLFNVEPRWNRGKDGATKY